MNTELEPAQAPLDQIELKQREWISAAKARGEREGTTIERKINKLSRTPITVPREPLLPPKWQWARLLQSSLLIVDCHNKTAPYVSRGIPLIRTTNVRNGKLNLEDTKFVSDKTFRKWSARCIPTPGDLIFTREAPVGEVGHARAHTENLLQAILKEAFAATN